MPNVSAKAEDTSKGELITAAEVMERYKISHMSLFRWLKDSDLGFPQPIVINRRRYFYAMEIQNWERARAARRVA